jgi:hypothetical protein
VAGGCWSQTFVFLLHHADEYAERALGVTRE